MADLPRAPVPDKTDRSYFALSFGNVAIPIQQVRAREQKQQSVHVFRQRARARASVNITTVTLYKIYFDIETQCNVLFAPAFSNHAVALCLPVDEKSRMGLSPIGNTHAIAQLTRRLH